MACHSLPQMRRKLNLALLVTALSVAPLSADLTGITTTPLNFPSSAITMTVGPDGNIWMLTDKGNLGKLTPSGTYTEFPIPWGITLFGQTPFATARDLTFGIDGNLWLIGINGHVARVTPSGTFTDYAVSTSFGFNDPLIVSGADGALWFYDGSSTTWKMDRIDIYGQVTKIDLGLTTAYPTCLVNGEDGNLWFIDIDSNQIFKFSPLTNSLAGTFPIPNLKLGRRQMVLGLDGNLWFPAGAAIDRVKPDGTITAFPIPSGATANGIVAGGDGNIWFAETASGTIGQLVVSSITSAGSATINESASILGGADQLFAFPGKFASSGKAASNSSCGQPCPGLTYLVRLYSGTGNVEVVSTTPPTACADIEVQKLSITSLVGFGGFDRVHVEVYNYGPNDADTTATVNLPPNLTVSNVGAFYISPTGFLGTVTSTISGNSVTLNAPLPCEGGFGANVVFQSTVNTQSVTAVAIAAGSLPDPYPTNNAQAVLGYFGSASRALPPPVLTPITNPVKRGQ